MTLLPALLLVTTICALLYVFLYGPSRVAVGAFLVPAAAYVWSISPVVLGRYGSIPPVFIVVGIALGVPLLAALVVLFRTKPVALLWAIVLAMPLRVPVPAGGQRVFLLLPLYAVVLAGLLSVIGDRSEEPLWRHDRLRLPLAALIAWAGLSVLWSAGVVTGTIRYLCFWVAFALLYHVASVMLEDSAQRIQAVRALLASGALLAGIGVAQRVTSSVIYNAKVAQGYFAATQVRVNSLFWDPNMLGRFLVLVLVFAAVELWIRRDRVSTWLAAVAGVLSLAALLFTYSRSGWLALGAAAVLLVWRGLGTKRAIVVMGVFVLVVAVAFIVIDTPKFNLPKRNARLYWEKLFSGRLGLVEGGAAMFAAHPVAGVGLGAFPAVFPRYRPASYRYKIVESHSSIVTIGAELGIVGLLLLGWLIVRWVWVARRATGGRSPDPPLGIAAAVSTAAIFVHSLLYGALFEDPFTWFLLAFAAVLAVGAGSGGSEAAGDESGGDSDSDSGAATPLVVEAGP